VQLLIWNFLFPFFPELFNKVKCVELLLSYLYLFSE
jgi:hypothetical protein